MAVESAQVLAGLVEYPAGNPFYIYHTKLWTILHQLLALPLASGASERTLSVLVSGLLGMVSFQALSLIAFAVSRDILIAIGAAALIFFSRVAEVGSVYPIWLVGTSHTYGILALSYAALVVGFIGCGWYRTGLFLLGLAPAVHPSIGSWLIVIAGLVFLSDFRRLSDELRPHAAAFVAGAAITAVSLAIQLLFVQDVPAVDPSTTDKYLAAFVSFWDVHRQPVDLNSGPTRVNALALVLGVFWLWRRPQEIPRPAYLIIRFAVATATLSLVLAVLSWIPPDRLPSLLLIGMPGRVLNLNMLICSGLLVGIAGAYRRTMVGGPLMFVIAVMLLVGNRSGLWGFEGHHQPFAAGLPSGARPNATNVLLIGAVLQAITAWHFSRLSRLVFARGWYVATVGVLAWSAVLTWNLDRPRSFDMADRTDDVLFQLLSQRPGLLLTGGDLHLVQLRTRRPVLLDGGGLDALPYAIESAPEMERILRDVYGVELLDPPDEARLRGVVPAEFTREVWQSYSLEQWQRIARRFDVRQVLTPGTWELKLPVAVRNKTLTVYDIPDFSR